MTSTALRFLADLLRFLPHISFVYVEHAGPVIHTAPLAECTCDDDYDLPDPDTYRLDEEALAALLEDGIAEYANGATREQARAHVMNSLVMRGIEADAEDEQ